MHGMLALGPAPVDAIHVLVTSHCYIQLAASMAVEEAIWRAVEKSKIGESDAPMPASKVQPDKKGKTPLSEGESDLPAQAGHYSVDSVDIWLMVDSEGLIQGCSPSVIRDLGIDLTAGDVRLVDLFRGENRKLAEDALEVARQGLSDAVPLEIAVWRKDAPDAHWDGDLVQIGGTGGEGLVLLRAHDVSHHKNSGEYLRQMVDQIREGVAVTQGTSIMFANEALARLLGYQDGDEVTSLDSVLELIDPNDREMLQSNIIARSSGQFVRNNYDLRARKKNGESLWVNVNMSQIDWGSGPAALATVTDISGEKLVAEAKRETERLFAKVFQLSPDMISLSRLDDGVIVDVNGSFLDLLGYTKEEVLGRSSLELPFWADENSRKALVAELRKNETVRNVEIKACRKSGEIINISASASRLKYGDNELLLFVGRDTTEERRKKQELQDSKDEAELASRSKSDFLANMSHELRTPLNAIIGFSEILGSELYGPLGDVKYKEYAADIHDSGNLLLEIISDILDLAKIEAGRVELQEGPVGAREILEESTQLLRAKAIEAGLDLKAIVPDEPLTLYLDRLRTKQILLNLLSNAIKFTHPGGTVEAGIRISGQGGFEIFVSDTGIGMSEDEVALALTPFGQIGSAMTRQSEGSGLGLPLVQAFAEMQDGVMRVESATENGTTVRLFFPEERIIQPD